MYKNYAKVSISAGVRTKNRKNNKETILGSYSYFILIYF